MSLIITFTDDATETLLSVAYFIENKWSIKQADEFLDKTYKVLDLVAQQPYMFKASSIKNNVRIGLISKQTSFFYEIKENEIIILFFWDNRQEPLFNS
jgi:plasmid stabilization system protein ParE